MPPRIPDNRNAVDPPTTLTLDRPTVPRNPKVIGAAKALVETVEETVATRKKITPER